MGLFFSRKAQDQIDLFERQELIKRLEVAEA